MINDEYSGLLVYDKKLNFIKKIKLAEDFVVYQLFSSCLNNWLIVQDVENEVLYSIETSVEKVVQICFKDIFYRYYFCEKNRAILKTSQNTYTFDFDTLKSIVEKQNNNLYRNMLINNQTSSLWINEDGQLELKYDGQTDYKGKFDSTFQYCIDYKKLIRFSEREVQCRERTWNTIVKVDNTKNIRNVVINTEFIYLLIDEKMDNETSYVWKIKI